MATVLKQIQVKLLSQEAEWNAMEVATVLCFYYVLVLRRSFSLSNQVLQTTYTKSCNFSEYLIIQSTNN